MIPNNQFNQFPQQMNMNPNMMNQFQFQNCMPNQNIFMNTNPMMANPMMNPMMMNQFQNNMNYMNMGFMNNMNMNTMNMANNMNMNNMNNFGMNMNNMNFNNGNLNNSFPNVNINNNQINQMDQINQINQNQANQISEQQMEQQLKELKKKEEEERKKKFRKIINKESGENLDKIDTISDMANMGAITRNYIEVDSTKNPNKYIPIPQALISPDQDYFILGILGDYLTKQGVVSAIEKRDQNQLSKEKLKEIDTFLQFLINGLTNLKKHELRFDFGWEKNSLILSDVQEQQGFMDELQIALSKGFNIKTNEIIVTYPRSGSVLVTVIFLTEDFNNITKDQIQNILTTHASFNNLISVNSNLVLDGILLNPELLDQRGDNKNQGWGVGENRGGRPYYPPKGWIGYGLRVLGKYDKGNNTWIGMNNGPGEWCVAYHGASQKLNQNYKTMRNVEDINHPGQKVGEGVYCSPNPSVLDQEGGVIQVGNKKYKIGFMLRVRPDKARIAKTNSNYWVLNGTSDEIRPYRILIKNLN